MTSLSSAHGTLSIVMDKVVPEEQVVASKAHLTGFTGEAALLLVVALVSVQAALAGIPLAAGPARMHCYCCTLRRKLRKVA